MRIRALLLLSPLVIVAAGCGNGEPAIPMTQIGAATTVPNAGPDLSGETFTDLTGKDTADVTVRDNVFLQPYIEVSAGTKVTFTNKGEQPHNVQPANDGAFKAIETANMSPDDVASIELGIPGDYPYYCSLHGTPTKGMVGAIRVLK